MYRFILFKNIRGSVKLNLELKKPIDNFNEIDDDLAKIIQYFTTKHNYNFMLSVECDLNSCTINQSSINLEYIYNALDSND